MSHMAHLRNAGKWSGGTCDVANSAWELRLAGNDQGALAMLRAALQDASNPVPLHLHLALMHHEAGDSGKTIEHCMKALKLDPEISLAYQLLGLEYSRSKFPKRDFGKAVGFIRKALETDPDNASAYEDLGRLVRISLYAIVQLDQWEEGTHEWWNAELVMPGLPGVQFRKLDEAVKYDRRSPKDLRGLLGVYYRMGMLYWYANNREELCRRVTVAASAGNSPAMEWLQELVGNHI